ncbi:MAG: YeiH family putative sulfate export transporter [Spirochaetes bacterium]|uniref:YeiH family putative sulfate export transporter n=1 Tax=Candidatus Gallitreponema excrementavium TaxID=2840840 RepID=A0A9D9HPJ5_9SPIR|nr:YeiH family putative sulfate export transporter [Candidatus Gallitreponema excrementavium]
MTFFSPVLKKLPGVLLCLVLSIPAYFLGIWLPVVGGPVFGILLGMVVTLFIKDKTFIQAGMSYTSKKILQYAVILLGFGMNISAVLEKGAQSLPIILVTIGTALITGFIVSKILKIKKNVGILVSVGSSICGGSAIAAAAPVINAQDDEIAQSISVIFLFNILAALLFPTLGDVLKLSNEGFGIFAGTAVNDTSSVTAAASAWDGIHNSNTLEDATIVKLTRTLAIIPITLVLALLQILQEKNRKNTGDNEVTGSYSLIKIFPWFVIWFLAASLITTFFNLPVSLINALKWLSKFFIIMAMTAIGLNTNIIKLVKTGGKPIVLGFICWILITASSLAMQHWLGIW